MLTPVAASGRGALRERIAELLVQSDLRYAMGGLVIATASFGDERAAEHLVTYLEVWLDHDERDAQELAMAALLHLRGAGVTSVATHPVAPGGAWHGWIESHDLGPAAARIGCELARLAPGR